MERLQGCLSGNSRHGWWVLWDDSQHMDTLIDWAEKVVDDMGRKAKKRFGKVCLQHGLPLFTFEAALCVFFVQSLNTLLIRPGTGWMQPKPWQALHCMYVLPKKGAWST